MSKKQKPRNKKMNPNKLRNAFITSQHFNDIKRKVYFVGGDCFDKIESLGVAITVNECQNIIYNKSDWTGKIFAFFIDKDGDKQYVGEDFVIKDKMTLAELQDTSVALFEQMLDGLWESHGVNPVCRGYILAPKADRNIEHLEKEVVDMFVKNGCYDEQVVGLANATKRIRQIGEKPEVILDQSSAA
jgi:hypothetical protein